MYPHDRYAAHAVVSGAALKQLLGLPLGARIHGLRWDSLQDAASVLIEHADLPVCPEGAQPVTIGLDEAIALIEATRQRMMNDGN